MIFNTVSLIIALALVFVRSETMADEPYCGVYCCFSVLRHAECDVEFTQLLEPQYIGGGWRGSSADDISRALNDFGLKSRVNFGKGFLDLLLADSPVILHVRRDRATKDYNHWVVYYGTRDGNALLLDPSTGERSLSFADLASLWDGVAITSSRDDLISLINSILIVFFRWGTIVSTLLFTTHCATIVTQFFTRLSICSTSLRNGSFFALAMIFGVGLFAFLVDLLRPDGLVIHGRARASIASVHQTIKFGELSIAEVRDLHQRSKVEKIAWVDARYSDDFETGSLPGAVNISIDCDFVTEEKMVERLRDFDKIIVFCQSESCPYASAVASRLQAHGLDGLLLFPGGILDWEKQSSPEKY